MCFHVLEISVLRWGTMDLSWILRGHIKPGVSQVQVLAAPHVSKSFLHSLGTSLPEECHSGKDRSSLSPLTAHELGILRIATVSTNICPTRVLGRKDFPWYSRDCLENSLFPALEAPGCLDTLSYRHSNPQTLLIWLRVTLLALLPRRGRLSLPAQLSPAKEKAGGS